MSRGRLGWFCKARDVMDAEQHFARDSDGAPVGELVQNPELLPYRYHSLLAGEEGPSQHREFVYYDGGRVYASYLVAVTM